MTKLPDQLTVSHKTSYETHALPVKTTVKFRV